jgi:hypothetical protein
MIFSYIIDEVIYTISSILTPLSSSSRNFSLKETDTILNIINETDLTFASVQKRLRLLPELSASITLFSCNQFIAAQIALIEEGYQIDVESLREILENVDKDAPCFLIKRILN